MPNTTARTTIARAPFPPLPPLPPLILPLAHSPIPKSCRYKEYGINAKYINSTYVIITNYVIHRTF